MKFYVNPLYVGATINKADINTTTGAITRIVSTATSVSAYYFSPRNSSGLTTSLPKSLKTDTVYYSIGVLGVYSYKIYSDEALTTQITFTADDVLDVTQFEILPFGSLGYAQPFHAGSSTLEEMMCCPPDRTRHGLAKFCYVYDEAGALIYIPYNQPLLFQSNEKGTIWGFWQRDLTSLYSGSPYTQPYHARIDIDPTDAKKIIVSYNALLGGGAILVYKSASILAEDFTGTIVVLGPAPYTSPNPAFFTLVFRADPIGTGTFADEVQVPPYAVVKLPNAKFKSPEGDISIGNIEERLTFDEPSNRYVGSVQTYYGIKGRLFLDVVFYPSPSSNIKYLGNRGPAGYANKSVGYISNVDITRTYTSEVLPDWSSLPFVFSIYNSQITFNTAIQYFASAYTYFAATPGLTYLAVSFAEISKGTKTGYEVTYNGVPADQNFRRTNVIKIVSTSNEAYVRSEYSTYTTPPPMPTPTPTPSATPKGTYLQTVPSVPFITSADGGSGSPAIINFEPPLNNGGATITGYEYQVDGGAWLSGSSISPILVEGLSVALHSVCIRAVNSIGGGASACVDVTPAARITTGFVYVGQSGGASYSGYGLSPFNKLMGVIESVGTAETMTFTINANGVLTYYFETSDSEGAGGVSGEMSVDGISIATTAGANNTSGTYDVTAGQSLVFTFTGATVSEFLFELHIIV